ncbi:MAG: YbhB/YbcL family Raf kinase inhibitor-like protein [Desulfovibrio sp.]
MRKMVCMIVIAWVLVGGGQVFASDAFMVTSPTLKAGSSMVQKHVLNGFGCSGENVSPELNWQNAPEGTKSFAITVYDPDAPTGSGWWHWVVFDLPVTMNGVGAGFGNEGFGVPAGVIQSRTDFGKAGYGGACPPKGHGDHSYIFTVYALDVATLGLTVESPAAMVGYHLGGHTLAKAVFTVPYGR